MISVFIGGSRRLSRVNSELLHRLDNIIQKQFRVLVGDANGFDRAAQAYLDECGYHSVVVYCTAGECRNNIGNWPVHAVDYQGKDRGLEFYTAKDDAMLNDADYGLFAWDAKSKGTLRNIRKMAELRKASAVYVSTIKKFVTVRSAEDALALSRGLPTEVASSQDLFSDKVTSALEISQAEKALREAATAYHRNAHAKFALGQILLTAEERQQWDKLDQAFKDAYERLLALQLGHAPTDYDLTGGLHSTHLTYNRTRGDRRRDDAGQVEPEAASD